MTTRLRQFSPIRGLSAHLDRVQDALAVFLNPLARAVEDGAWLYATLEAPTPVPDGTVREFTLEHEPVGLHAFKDGLVLAPSTYRVEGRTLVLAAAPAPGEVLLVSYRYRASR